MGLGQAAQEVWSRLGGDEFHISVAVQLAEREAEREADRRRVARVGQGGLETSTRATELTSD